MALATVHRNVLARYAVPRAEVFGEPRLNWVKRQVAALNPSSLVDVGCGIAYSTYVVADGRPFTGIDMDEGNLALARDILTDVDGAKLVHSTAGEIPLDAASADCVLMTEVLEHLDDERPALAEVLRVLRPGGTLLVTVPGLRFGFDSSLRFLPVRTVHDVPGPEFHVRPGYNIDDMRDLLEGAGFIAKEVHWLVGPVRRLLQDGIGLGHIAVQRLMYGRSSWNWSGATETEGSAAFSIYSRARPLLRRLASLDERLSLPAGFQVVARAIKPEAS